MPSTMELLDLYTAYSVGLDNQDRDLFLSCFTQDAVIESPAQTARGHDEISAWMALTPDGFLHHSFNILVVEASGLDTVCRADWLVYDTGAAISRGIYRDMVRNDGSGGLRFSKRVITRTWRRPQEPDEGTT